MMNDMKYEKIPASQFTFVSDDKRLHDKKLETKPIGYFKDAMMRFMRNKSSVVAAFIILFLVLYTILVPLFFENNYTRALTDTTYMNYIKLPPKSRALGWLGMDGLAKKTVNTATYNTLRGIGEETGLNPVVEVYRENYKDPTASKNATFCDIKIDTYYQIGMMYMTLTPAQFEDIQRWQDETGIQVIYPAISDSKQKDANVWYNADKKGAPKLDKDGNFDSIYRTTTKTDTLYHSLRIAADNDPEKPLAYARVAGTESAKSYITRICKYTYFQYRYGFEPQFLFGTNAKGQDILTRMAAGAGFSFVLAICISSINMFIGAIWGAVSGYYGGRIDLTMERITDVLGNIPFTVTAILFQLHLSKQVGIVPALAFAFILTGWIGMSSRVRMQFYRFKKQEYVLASRTLGARDWRIMFKHIFPNSLGTIITGSILMIPGVIFTESSLTYLGIINLESSTMTSLGTLLANGKNYVSTDPYIILFPSLFISLLMISFNLFGNGLRDAFNPSLRGAE